MAEIPFSSREATAFSTRSNSLRKGSAISRYLVPQDEATCAKRASVCGPRITLGEIRKTKSAIKTPKKKGGTIWSAIFRRGRPHSDLPELYSKYVQKTVGNDINNSLVYICGIFDLFHYFGNPLGTNIGRGSSSFHRVENFSTFPCLFGYIDRIRLRGFFYPVGFLGVLYIFQGINSPQTINHHSHPAFISLIGRYTPEIK